MEQGLIYLFDASWDDGGSPFVQVSPGGLIEADEYIQGFDGYAFIPPTSGSDHSPSGIYKVQVAGGPGYSTITGSYSLALLSATDDHSNDGETATDVSWGQTIHGSHEYRTDIDVFRLQVEDGHAYQMEIRSEAHSGAVLQLSVNEAALTVNLQEKLVWSSSQSEVLYLSTRTLKTGTGPYSLTLTEFQDDHADQLGKASATTVSLGQTLEGKIEHPADRDMFRIVNEAEDRCRIEVQPGSLPDAFIRHYPPLQQSPAFYACSAGGGLAVLECQGDYVAVRRFVGLNLTEALPDETTILNFRHLLERHELGQGLLEEINAHLESQGLRLREGTIVDASIIEAPSSTKNRARERDPEMHQAKKGNQWHFGMKAHIGVDSETGIVHSMSITAANAHDVTEAHNLLHGGETQVWCNAGYQGVHKR